MLPAFRLKPKSLSTYNSCGIHIETDSKWLSKEGGRIFDCEEKSVCVIMFSLSECSLVFLPGDEQQLCKFLPRTSREGSQLITGFFLSRPVILGEGGRRGMTCCKSPVIYCCRKNSVTLGLRNSHSPPLSSLCSGFDKQNILTLCI